MTDTHQSDPICPVCSQVISQNTIECAHCKSHLSPIDSSPRSSADFYNRGLDLHASGDRDAAIHNIHGALALDPQFVDAYIVLGKILISSESSLAYQQAILAWRKARDLEPNAEQSSKLAVCLNTAEGHMKSLQDRDKRVFRRRATSIVFASLGLALIGGLAGFFLHRPEIRQITVANSNLHRRESNPVPQVIYVNSPVPTVSKNANISVESALIALKREDIHANRSGGKVRLTGKVRTQEEKQLLAGAVKIISKISVDDTKLQIHRESVSGRFVQKMLKIVAENAGNIHVLSNAKIEITGGDGEKPLYVIGRSGDVKAAGQLISTLVKNIYPSANRVDISRLKSDNSRALLKKLLNNLNQNEPASIESGGK